MLFVACNNNNILHCWHHEARIEPGELIIFNNFILYMFVTEIFSDRSQTCQDSKTDNNNTLHSSNLQKRDILDWNISDLSHQSSFVKNKLLKELKCTCYCSKAVFQTVTMRDLNILNKQLQPLVETEACLGEIIKLFEGTTHSHPSVVTLMIMI